MFPPPSKGKDGKTWFDYKGHPLASWDGHQACRSCLNNAGILCSRRSPCPVCENWPDSLWVAVEKAETAAARKRAQRAQRSLSKPTLSVSTPHHGGSVVSAESTELLLSLRDTLSKLAPVFLQAGVPLGGTESGAAIARLPSDSRPTPASDRPRRDPTPPGTVALDLTLTPLHRSARETRPLAGFVPPRSGPTLSGFPEPPRVTRRGVCDRPGPAATAGSRGFSLGSSRTPTVAGIRPESCRTPALPLASPAASVAGSVPRVRKERPAPASTSRGVRDAFVDDPAPGSPPAHSRGVEGGPLFPLTSGLDDHGCLVAPSPFPPPRSPSMPTLSREFSDEDADRTVRSSVLDDTTPPSLVSRVLTQRTRLEQSTAAAAEVARSRDFRSGVIEQLSLGTIWAVLQDTLGSPRRVTRASTVRAMSVVPQQATDSLQVPFSPFVEARFSELSSALGGTDTSAELSSSNPTRFGTLLARGHVPSTAYRVPRATYSFRPSRINEDLLAITPSAAAPLAVSDSVLQRLEEDSRQVTLAASFLDVSGAAVSKLIQGITQVAHDPEKVLSVAALLSDLEKARGQATEHILAQSITMDCNVKLLRRTACLSSSKLSAAHKQKAYNLPFVAKGGTLFPGELTDILQSHHADLRRASEARLAFVVADVAKHIGAGKLKSSTGPPPTAKPTSTPRGSASRGGKATRKRGRPKGKPSNPPAAKAPRKQP